MTGFEIKNRRVKTYDFATNGKKILRFTLDAMGGLAEGVTAQKIYFVGGKYLLYASDKVLYVREGTYLTPYVNETFNRVPCVLEFNVDCTRTVLISSTNKTVIKRGSNVTEVEIPHGNKMVYFKDKLFITDGFKVYYSKPTTPFDFSSGIVSGGYYVPESVYGGIKGFFPDVNVLYLICEKAIIGLNAVGEEDSFTADIISTSHLSVLDNSVAYVGNVCYFLSANKVGVLKGGKVKFYDTEFLNNFTVIQAETFKDYYVVNCGIDEEYKLFYCDSDFANSGMIDSIDVVGAEGYSVDTSEAVYYSLEEILPNTIDGKYDFGISELKTITTLDIKVQGSATLKISGDFGEKRYAVKEGNNAIYCNSESKIFFIEFVARSEDFKVERIKAKYKTYGG